MDQCSHGTTSHQHSRLLTNRRGHPLDLGLTIQDQSVLTRQRLGYPACPRRRVRYSPIRVRAMSAAPRSGQAGATSAADAGGRSTVIKEGQPEGATRTVVIAVLANLGVALAKAVATLMTGSAAMLAETVHSLADTANEILLYVGLRRSRPEPDASHPFGYGQERWFWSFLAALGIFLVGGVLAIAEGIRSLLKPEPLESFAVGMGVLLV